MTPNRLSATRAVPPSFWHNLVVLFFLLDTVSAFGIIDNLVYGHWLGKGGDKITQSLQLMMIASSIYLFSKSYRLIGIRTGAALALLLMFYLFMTSFWSMDSGATTKEAIVYLVVIIGVIGIAGKYRFNKYVGMLFFACLVSAVASVLLYVVSPANAVMEDGGGMEGIFSHKNTLGQVMATAVLATLYYRTKKPSYRVLKIIGIVLFIALAAASRSATALLTIFVFCGASAFTAGYRAGGGSRPITVAIAAIVVPLLIMFLVYPDPILDLIGKDPTLTGRTEIWGYVMDDIAIKPLLGWGYFGFWIPSNPYALEIASTVHWFVPQSHNGVLEIVLTTGFVGFVLFAVLFVRNIVLAIRCLRTPDSDLAVFTLVHCVGIVMTGVSEMVLLAPIEPSTTVFFITGLMCERALVMARTRQRHAVPRAARGPMPVGPSARFSRFR
ncbi:MAG TPA: O-antigen ligase [Aliidongia sp.]|nr:O-antigen ligase [Aliidongia sp.]